METILNPDNDTTYIFNYWATWCKPCVKELPFFEKLSVNYSDKKVKVIFMSLDFKRQFESTLLPFLQKHNISSDVYLIDEMDYNSWIDKVDPSWSGAIPATLILNSKSGIRQFYEKEFVYEELENLVQPLIIN